MMNPMACNFMVRREKGKKSWNANFPVVKNQNSVEIFDQKFFW